MNGRPYQRRQIRRVVGAFERGARGTLLVSATGTGKTFVATQAAAAYHDLTGYPTLHLAPTLETLDQALRGFRAIYPEDRIGVMHGPQNSVDQENAVVISTPHTMREPSRYASIVQAFPQGLGAIICDEAHHFMAPQTMRLVEALRGLGPAAMPIGLTATPERADERHLLDLFDDLSSAYDILDAMHDAYLPDLHPYTVKTGISLKDVKLGRDYDQVELERAVNVDRRNAIAVEQYLEHAEGLPGIAFCAGVQHANAMHEAFERAGVKSAVLHDNLTARQRRNIVDQFRAGRLQMITGYNIPLEGLDLDCRVGLWLRPSPLEHIYTQASGRLMRPAGEIAALLGETKAVEDRRSLLEATKGYSIIIELRDDDPRAVRKPTVGIASILGLPPTLKLTGEPVRFTSQRMDLIASRMPDRARFVDSDKTIKIFADAAEVHFGVQETPMLPDALRRSRVQHQISWQPHGPRRYAAPLLLERGAKVREDAIVLSGYGDLWAVEHARHGTRTPIQATKTFEDAIKVAARYHRENHHRDEHVNEIRRLRTPDDLRRLGAPFSIALDGTTLNLRETIQVELSIAPNRFRDRARMWDRVPLAQPRRLDDRDIAFTSTIHIDPKKQDSLVHEAEKARGISVERGETRPGPPREPERNGIGR